MPFKNLGVLDTLLHPIFKHAEYSLRETVSRCNSLVFEVSNGQISSA